DVGHDQLTRHRFRLGRGGGRRTGGAVLVGQRAVDRREVICAAEIHPERPGFRWNRIVELRARGNDGDKEGNDEQTLTHVLLRVDRLVNDAVGKADLRTPRWEPTADDTAPPAECGGPPSAGTTEQ